MSGLFSYRGSASSAVNMLVALNRSATGDIGLDSSTSGAFVTLGTYNGTYNDGNWHHVVSTINYSTGAFNVYIDQTLRITGTNASISRGTADKVQLGTNYGSQFLNGDIDQVRIYNTVLSSADVTALFGETAATSTTAAFPSGQTAVATYTMDTSANGLLNTQDLSTVNYPAGAGCLALYEMNGNSNDTSGTYNGTPTNITYQGGAFDQAALFDGTVSNEIDLNYNTNYNNFSISAWINPSAISSAHPIVGKWWDGSNRAFQFWLTSSGVGVDIAYTDSNTDHAFYNTNVGALSTNRWYFVCVTWENGVGLTLTVDDNTQTHSISKNIRTNTSNWFIGQQDSRGLKAFTGLIDQVRIYNSALTQSQVTTLARGIATSYSGTATNVNFNGYLNFQPDFVWIKNRDYSGGISHFLADSIRGGQQRLVSNTAAAEVNLIPYGDGVMSFNSNGFTVADDPNGDNGINGQVGGTYGSSYVAWNWKAGGAAVTNNDGTISSQVSANKDSGFSIATYTGVGYPNSTTAEVGHGLLQAPELVFIKGTGGTGQSGGAGSWVMGTGVLPTNNWAGSMYLNYDTAYYTAINYFWNGAATDSVVKLKTDWFVNGNNNQYVMYSWHSVAGYSKIGSYTGTNAINTITTGFEPTFLMVKLTSAINGQWVMYDNARSPTNPRTKKLAANSSVVENDGSLLGGDSVNQVNFTSTGFELLETSGAVNTNKLNETYIYLAIK